MVLSIKFIFPGNANDELPDEDRVHIRNVPVQQDINLFHEGQRVRTNIVQRYFMI